MHPQLLNMPRPINNVLHQPDNSPFSGKNRTYLLIPDFKFKVASHDEENGIQIGRSAKLSFRL